MINDTVTLIIKKDGTPGTWYYNGEPTDPITMIDDMVRDAKAHKCEIFVHFLGLSKCALIISNILYKMGYTPVVNARKNDMHVGQYRYRITKENAYYIQVKVGYKSWITLQCVENVIGLRQLPQTIADADKAMSLYKYIRTEFLKGKKRSDNRILYSSASISRTLFNRDNPDFCKSVGAGSRVTVNGISYRKGYFCERYNRPGAHGGMCYVSELGYKYRGSGIVLDVNSLYDYVMCHYDMPQPRLLAGGYGTMPRRYLNRKLFYTVQKVEVTATLKDDGVACIAADNSQGNKYLTGMTKRVLTLNQSDRDLLFDNYSISYYRIKSYMVFSAGNDAYKKYILPLYEQKRTLPKGVQRDYVKMCLVGFIGTMARKVHKQDYVIDITDDDVLYGRRIPCSPDEYETRMRKSDGLCYIDNAVVAAAKHYIIGYIKKYQDRFLYTDTDSIHLAGVDIPADIPISDRLGDFKVEHTFTDCIYHGQKAYALKEDGVITPTIAGTPKDTHFDDLDDIFTKPYKISLINEDVETLEVSYKEEERNFNRAIKSAEDLKAEKSYEWYDSNVVIPEMLKGHKMPGAINRWNFYESRKADSDINSFGRYMQQMTARDTYIVDIAALVKRDFPENYKKYKDDYYKVHKTFTTAS